MSEVVDDVVVILVLLEISPDLPLDKTIPGPRYKIDSPGKDKAPELPNSESGNPEYESAGPNEEEDEVPVPDHEEDFVVDHVQPQHTQGVLLLLPPTRPVPDVVAGRQAREDLAHGVEVEHGSLLGRHGVPLVHPEPVAQELVVQELVDHKYLRDDDEEVGGLTAVETEGVSVIFVVEVLLK